MDAQVVALRLYEEETDSLRLIGASGSPITKVGSSYQEVEMHLSLSEDGHFQRVFKYQRFLHVKDYTSLPDARELAIRQGFKSIYSVWIGGPDGPISLLNATSGEEEHFDQERIDFLDAFAAAMTTLIESARLSEHLTRQQQEMSLVDGVARIMTSTLDSESVYEAFFDEVSRIVDFDMATVVTTDPQDGNSRLVFLTDPQRTALTRGQPFGLEDGLSDVSGRINRTDSVSDISNLVPREPFGLLTDDEFSSLVMSPLLAEGNPIGELTLFNVRPEAYGERERLIMDRLANQVAPVVRNAHLYAHSDQLALALDSIGDGVALLGTDGVIQHVNTTFESLFGIPKKEAVGSPLDRLGLTTGPEEEEGWSRETVQRTRSGKLLDIAQSSAPVRDQKGQLIGRINILRDITENNRMLARMNEQSRLASIGQLAAGVAHEINNPLATVLLTCDYIIRTGAGEGIADELDSITKSTQRAARIVQNLLTFARGDTPEFKPMSMESVVAMALELKKSDFTTNNISVSPSADEDVPATSIDPNQMLQVMLNLLNNSQHSLARSGTGGKSPPG